MSVFEYPTNATASCQITIARIKIQGQVSKTFSRSRAPFLWKAFISYIKFAHSINIIAIRTWYTAPESEAVGTRCRNQQYRKK